ncbi:hypothetical protein PPYR_13477 [Photinus pyralis]|uniref:RUN domain-containing protein n=2 Tax=Photinus pyralis TaxID=7054 RepID=A0A5N4A973_PHOPY|nr:uncharacterized protein LOC116178493 [Photinus pyralis]KAB0793857.1 hypothetical protein PPYR_13477 [Photinus pyralis]
MSVSDPLIKNIKWIILKLIQDVEELGYISDTNVNLISLCENVEKVFNSALSSVSTTFGFIKATDAWSWLEKAAVCGDSSITFAYVNSVEHTAHYQHILTRVGRLRLLIRNLLSRKALHVPVEYLLKNHKCGIYKQNSVLGDEILTEILLSLFRQCSQINFKLDLSNISFLDVTWELPEIVKLELVPCTQLGISISFANEKAVIIDIQSNSVIAENGRIEVGDLLDNLSGVHICSATKGKLNAILKSCKGQPVNVTIVKARSSGANEIFKPILALLKQVHIDPVALRSKNFIRPELNWESKSTSAGFKATFFGLVHTGKLGDVKQIDKAVRLLLSPYKKTDSSDSKHKVVRKPIYFEVGEIGVKVVDSQSSNVILKHSYMEISSCGSVSHLPYYFAYIAGNENCSNANEFICYVFHVKNFEFAYTILQSIGQGFQRTHFAV